jgi:GGDEF domain-containing protein
MFKKPGISGQLQNGPDLPALHQLLSQALAQRGRQVQVIWRTHHAITFTLVLICNVRGDPRWCLYAEQNGKQDLLFDYSSCDVLLVLNLITSSSADLQKSGKSPFLANNKLTRANDFSSGSMNASTETGFPDSTQNPGDRDSFSQPGVEMNTVTFDELQRQSPPVNSWQPIANTSKSRPQESGSDPRNDTARLQSPDHRNDTQPKSKESVDKSNDFVVEEIDSEVVPTLIPRTIDSTAIQSVMTSLRQQDTGMFTHAAFLYFLEQEYFRCLRTRSSMTVLVFSVFQKIELDGQVRMKRLSNKAVVDLVSRLSKLKRHPDVLAHYESSAYALLLPNTRTVGAQSFAERAIMLITAAPLGGIAQNDLLLSFGCASIPEDCIDLPKLLGAAELAMRKAKALGSPLVIYRDLKESLIETELAKTT